ncbi:MAG: GDSL-type esterase/lipase family protein [Eubacteriales bacterium]
MTRQNRLKSALSLLTAAALILPALPTATVWATTGDFGGNWTVDGSTYTCNERVDWPNFSTYLLGDQNAASAITLTADVPIGSTANEATGNGGDSGFLFAVSDLNGNGIIEEGSDRYYLVEFTTYSNGVYVGIERNDKSWSGFAARTPNMLYSVGDVANLSVTYFNGSFTVTVDGTEVLTWTDADPLTGTGYGLCSKITGEVFRNVSVTESEGILPALSDLTLTEDVYQSIHVGENDNVTLDLAGHRVAASVYNRGTLTIVDSVGGGMIEISSCAGGNAAAVFNYGTLVLDGGYLLVSGSGSTVAIGIYNAAGATLSVHGGTVRSISKETYGFAIQNYGTIEEITGGELTSEIFSASNLSNVAAITNDGGTILSISGGEIYARRFAATGANDRVIGIRNRGGGRIESISGGIITAEGVGSSGSGAGASLAYGIWNIESSTIVEISGGVITGYSEAQDFTFGIRNEATINKISGGTIRAICNHSSGGPNILALGNWGTVGDISGGVFYAYKAYSSSGVTAGIRSSGGSVTVSGGAFYGNKNDSGIIFTAGGTVTYADGCSLTDQKASGYYYVTDGSEVTESYDTEKGCLTATVSGKTYELVGNAEAAAIGNTVYRTVADAITAAEDGETVKLLGDVASAITIPAGKTLTLDLAGHTVTASVTNNGTLTLTDSVGTGLIAVSSSAAVDINAVTNYGSLTLESGTLRSVGFGASTQCIGVYNKSGASLSIHGGRIICLTDGAHWGFCVRNAGTIEEITGGFLLSDLLNKTCTNNCAGITQDAGGVLKSVSGGEIWARNGGNGGDGSYAAGIRLQGSSTLGEISGGMIRALALGSSGNTGYGLYVNSGSVGEISGGFIGGYTTGTTWGHGVRVDAGSTVALISGGYLYGNKTNGDTSCNVLALNLYGRVDAITGGTFYASSAGNTYAVRSSGSTASIGSLSGGTFYSNGIGDSIRRGLFETASGTITFADGYYLGGADENGLCEVKPLSDEVIFFLGSSVTYGSATGGRSFVDLIDTDDNGISTVKSAISGTTLVNNGTTSYVARLQTEFKKYGTPDKLIVQLSTNDATTSQPLGTLSDSFDKDDFDQTTVIGAIEYIIAYAKETWGCEVIFYTNCPYDSDNYAAMVDALYEIHGKWGIGIVDFYAGIGVNEPTCLATYMNDSIHPNIFGYRYMADEMESYFEENYNQGHIEEDSSCLFCGQRFIKGYIDSESNAITTTYHTAFVQNRLGSEEGKFDLRILVVSDANEVQNGYTYELVFRQEDKDDWTVTRTIGVDMKLYQSATAAGQVYTAAEGCLLYGVVVTDIPENGFDTFTLTLKDADGNVISTVEVDYTTVAPELG